MKLNFEIKEYKLDLHSESKEDQKVIYQYVSHEDIRSLTEFILDKYKMFTHDEFIFDAYIDFNYCVHIYYIDTHAFTEDIRESDLGIEERPDVIRVDKSRVSAESDNDDLIREQLLKAVRWRYGVTAEMLKFDYEDRGYYYKITNIEWEPRMYEVVEEDH